MIQEKFASSNLELFIKTEPTSGYAAIENSVPMIQSLEITNKGDAPLEDIELTLTCNPQFAKGITLRFERILSKETRKFGPLDLDVFPDRSLFAGLSESMFANMQVTVKCQNIVIWESDYPIEILAHDQWAGLRSLPEILAAFSMPNDPSVDEIVGKASKLLRAKHPELSMSGYQSGRPEEVLKQVAAIYKAIVNEQLQYANPPASFGIHGQKIRSPQRIMSGRVATCLDLAMLFASCFEQTGLRPVVLLKEGHAWLGVWLHEVAFPQAFTDDVQVVRKCVDTKELIVLEATLVAMATSSPRTFKLAYENGQQHLFEEKTFKYALDIFRAREAQIRPLPQHSVFAKANNVPEELDIEMSFEEIPDIPTFQTEKVIETETKETPVGRMAKWKSKLLDLTKRNPLLNFKHRKAGLSFFIPNLGMLEDALSEGTEFKIVPLFSLSQGEDPRAKIPQALNDMAVHKLKNRELLVTDEDYMARLLDIHKKAKTGLEESGANTLYLALGFLEWIDQKEPEKKNYAPLLLLPVVLTRNSVLTGFRLSRHDDETIINPTLLRYLENEFALSIPGLNNPPTDDKGLDVPQILQMFKLAVRDIKGWEIHEYAELGIFSFSKYLMWKDLHDREEELKKNAVVKHLIEKPGKPYAVRSSEQSREQQLDKTHAPQDIFAPMLLDSSQLKAICSVEAGTDLVLEGPPGTGKSQTITNLIAHSLAKGKTVLFVSEKMAALEVVHSRLNKIGLEPFCLELHSTKAKKGEVLQQLGKSLDLAAKHQPEDWNREAQRLQRLRQELNALVHELHHPHPNGFTVYNAIGAVLGASNDFTSNMPWLDANVHNRDQIEEMRETVERMQSIAKQLTSLSSHPLAEIRRKEWTSAWQAQFAESIEHCLIAINEFTQGVQGFEELFEFPAQQSSIALHKKMAEFAGVLLSANNVPASLLMPALQSETIHQLQALITVGETYNQRRADVSVGWKNEIFTENPTKLQQGWQDASKKWWPKSVLDKQSFLKKISSLRNDGKTPAPEQFETMLDALLKFEVANAALVEQENTGKQLLGSLWLRQNTNWGHVRYLLQWSEQFSQAMMAVVNDDTGMSVRSTSKLVTLMSNANVVASTQLGKVLQKYCDVHLKLQNAWSRVLELSNMPPIPETEHAAIDTIQSKLNTWSKHTGELRHWCLWNDARSVAFDKNLHSIVTNLESGKLGLDDLVAHFDVSYKKWWLEKTIDDNSVLRSFSSIDHERKIQAFRESDLRFEKLTQEQIVATLAARIPRATAITPSAESEMGLLLRELKKQKRHKPLRQLAQSLPTLLPKLKPCMLMSPLSVAQYLGIDHAQFDLVIFDEASQIPTWDAIGAIARGKQLVVVGDPKQLPPTNFFNKSIEDDEIDSEEVEDLESVLDECLGAGLDKLGLKWHYRSRSESLIMFSNRAYYNSELLTFPSPDTNDTALRFEHVLGVYDRGHTRTNRGEADAIVAAIESHFLSEEKVSLSLGVITFNQAQQNLIETLLEERRRNNDALDKAIAAKENLGTTQESLFIKNLENVQGDERDIILFSITYGADENGKIAMNFGPLNKNGGHRRLNVAITRARKNVVVYSSLRPEQIDLGRVGARGVQDLKGYLEFAIHGPQALRAQNLLGDQDADSPFEEQVMRALRDKGWKLHSQVGCGGYRIDIGVVDPNAPGRYLAGIECDGATYHSAATARDRDRLRQHVLENLGWKILRVWSTNWWSNAKSETEKLHASLEGLVNAIPILKQAQHQNLIAAAPEFHSIPEDISLNTIAQLEENAKIFSSITLLQQPAQLFYNLDQNKTIVSMLEETIAQEAPMQEMILFQRVARAWGLERTGARIVERLRSLLPPEFPKTQEETVVYIWPKNTDPKTWNAFRVAEKSNEYSQRSIHEICQQEIKALVIYALKQHGSAPKQDVVRFVCKKLGMMRMPIDAENRGMAVVLDMIQAESIVEKNGVLFLHK